MKPRTKDQLVGGITDFWRLVTVEKCRKYTNHLQNAILKIIEVNGEATGF